MTKDIWEVKVFQLKTIGFLIFEKNGRQEFARKFIGVALTKESVG